MNATPAEWKASGNTLEGSEDNYLNYFVFSMASLFSPRVDKTFPGTPMEVVA